MSCSSYFAFVPAAAFVIWKGTVWRATYTDEACIPSITGGLLMAPRHTMATRNGVTRVDRSSHWPFQGFIDGPYPEGTRAIMNVRGPWNLMKPAALLWEGALLVATLTVVVLTSLELNIQQQSRDRASCSGSPDTCLVHRRYAVRGRRSDCTRLPCTLDVQDTAG